MPPLRRCASGGAAPPAPVRRVAWVLLAVAAAAVAAADARRSHYDVLGVGRGADLAEIRSAYKRLAKQYHPDRNPEPGAGEAFMAVSAAHETLADEGARREYDASLNDPRGAHWGRGGAGGDPRFGGGAFRPGYWGDPRFHQQFHGGGGGAQVVTLDGSAVVLVGLAVFLVWMLVTMWRGAPTAAGAADARGGSGGGDASGGAAGGARSGTSGEPPPEPPEFGALRRAMLRVPPIMRNLTAHVLVLFVLPPGVAANGALAQPRLAAVVNECEASARPLPRNVFLGWVVPDATYAPALHAEWRPLLRACGVIARERCSARDRSCVTDCGVLGRCAASIIALWPKKRQYAVLEGEFDAASASAMFSRCGSRARAAWRQRPRRGGVLRACAGLIKARLQDESCPC